MIYDAIVIGGGPSGAVLAYELARRGLEVLIIEKATLPRYKACGGGLPLKTVQCLPYDVSSTFELEARGGVLSYRGRQMLKVETQRPTAWLVMRDRFDSFLVEQAVQAGAGLAAGLAVTDVEKGEKLVAARTGKGPFLARLLAGADGVNSVVARSVGLLPRRRVGTAIEAEVVVSTSALVAQGAYATFDFGALPHGYGWIFPKADHLSAGVFQAWPGKAVRLRCALERFVASQAVLRDHKGLSLHGHRIPLGGRPERLHQGRVLLVGDAANLADPWLGEGIYYAVLSARMAAETMAAVLEGGTIALGDYTARVNAEITPQLRSARLLGNLIYRLPHLGSILLSRSPLIQADVFATVRGDITFEQLNRRLARGLPRILVQALRREGEPV